MSLDIRSAIKILQNNYSALKYNFKNLNEPIRYYDFWKTQLPEEMWFSRFIQYNGLISNPNKAINFCSVLGRASNLNRERSGINILFLGENINADRFRAHKSAIEQRAFDLSLGFEHEGAGNYMRFPLWILYLFKPEFSYADVKRQVASINQIKYADKSGFCALVARHDTNGVRTQIFNKLNGIGKIASAGSFFQ